MSELEPRSTSSSGTTPTSSKLVLRGAVGGLLMGLANLVPGISGGTMLLAAGIYPRFVQSVADVATLRWNRPSLLVLSSVVLAAVLSVLLFAGTIKDLVVHHRWIMYSLFIGLTLGGVPVVWRLLRPANSAVAMGAVGGFALMVVLALGQGGTGTAATDDSNFLMMTVAGLAGASAMILPGISGGYLLLLLGQYLPILSGIDEFKTALKTRDFAAVVDPTLNMVLPVGLGVVIGVVVVSSLVRWLLRRYAKLTLGALLGLLLGAVFGLWPFQQMVEPVLGETVIKGRVVTAENLAEFDAEDYPMQGFRPQATQVAGAIGFIVLGFALTTLVARLGGDSDDADYSPNAP